MQVCWLKAAVRSLRAIHYRIASDNPEAASKVFRRIQSAISHLASCPECGRQGRVPGTREVVLPQLSYIIVYRIRGTDVEILRVFHTSMNWPPLME